MLRYCYFLLTCPLTPGSTRTDPLSPYPTLFHALLLSRVHLVLLFHKLGKLVIGDVGDVHPEAVNLDLMRGALVGLGQLAVTAHQEYAAWHPEIGRAHV